MKKLLGILMLVLSLTVFCGAQAADLPSAGDEISGFKVVETRDFPLIDATVVRFEHMKTGAEVFYIANDDNNRVFDLVFHTVAENNTGLPHVFEHATLSGSEKYPSTDLFFNLSYQTYNTFMNAATYDIMTSYPVASLSEAQLLKLADFYTDSCLHPIIMERESIFRTESWRYRLNSPEDKLTYEGTVYSEMLGANTLSRLATQTAYRTAFPGSTIGNNQGGDNDAIPDMTWDMLKEYHDTYYHPSNCVAYLYGNIENYGAFLNLLAEAFAPYERREIRIEDAGYTPITEPVVSTVAYPMEEGSDTSRNSQCEYVIVCPDVKEEELIDFEIAADLLGSQSSDLMTALKEAIPYGSFSCGVDLATPDPCVDFTARNIDPADAETFRRIVDEQLALAASRNFSDEQIDAEMASLAVSVRLIRENSSVGVESIIPSFAYYYMGTDNPWYYCEYVENLDRIAGKNSEGVYSGLIARNMAGNPLNAQVTAYPEPGLREKVNAELEARLAEIKAGMSEEEIAAIVEASVNPPTESADTASMVASLTAVTTDTLPEEIKTYDIRDYTDDSGLRRIETPAGIDGIGEVDVMLNASGIAVEDLHYFRLLTHLVGRMDSEYHTQAELTLLMNRYLYNGSLRTSLVGDPEGNVHPYYRMSWIAADADLQTGYDLVYELAFELNLNDTEKLLNAVHAVKSAIRSDINNGYMVLLYRAMGRKDQTSLLYTYMNQVEYYGFLEQAEALLESDPGAFTAELARVREQLRNGFGAIVMYAGSEDSIAVNKPLAGAFIARLNNEEITPVSYESIPVPAAREGLVIEGNVNFNLLASDYASMEMKGYSGDLDAVTSMVSDMYLMPVLRDQYGAYGVLHGGMEDYGLYIISYRDPKVAEFFSTVEQLDSQIASQMVTQDTLNGYILSAYASYATSAGELSGAVSAELDLLEGKNPERALDRMRALKSLTPEAVTSYAGVYTKLAETGTRATAASLATIQANAELYDVVLNPLGIVPKEEAPLTDVPEDHPFAAAIAAVLERGAMSAEDNAFRPDETASFGDLVFGIYLLVVGEIPADTAEAYTTLCTYGLLLEGGDVEADLTFDDLNAQVKCILKNGYGVDLDETFSGAGDLVTRAELAHVFYYVWIEE